MPARMIRTPRFATLLACPVAALVACSGSHAPARPCTPETAEEVCTEAEACRETLEGDYLCMQICDDLTSGSRTPCRGGEACLNRTPGPPYVCWPGGPLTQGDPCERSTECGHGLACNLDDVCEEVCEYPEGSCSTPGLQCVGAHPG